MNDEQIQQIEKNVSRARTLSGIAFVFSGFAVGSTIYNWLYWVFWTVVR